MRCHGSAYVSPVDAGSLKRSFGSAAPLKVKAKERTARLRHLWPSLRDTCGAQRRKLDATPAIELDLAL